MFAAVSLTELVSVAVRANDTVRLIVSLAVAVSVVVRAKLRPDLVAVSDAVAVSVAVREPPPAAAARTGLIHRTCAGNALPLRATRRLL